ncbi:uncharacterized protein LOC128897126 isoform X4 [Hylaeus anthracinus]|uniref:uncharacterized protein LOC128897126 isoform X4 n=1 Tax=Hylaeus anthracinus TaxID=313031 RepID=UPI0023B9E284|nr:uncharacterized protein LOC128897126 isoform X4 [Hylaeus anthracinus]
MPGVCPRCNREVYFAEEKLALGKVWHTFCFSCRNCRKLLNSCSVVTHLGELFCKSCYVHLSTVNHEIKGIPNSPATVKLSAQDSLNCYRCSGQSSIDNVSLSRKQHCKFDACRLRGGGSEVEETNVSLDEEKSPTAVTTWYNRQHSKFRSTLPLEPQKNTVIAKDCPYEVRQQESDLSELKSSLSNNEIDVTDPSLSADKTRATTTDWTNKIKKYEIPPRRKFTYPPVPPPRSPLPSRRRVSFCDVVFGDTRENEQNCITKMQDVRRRPCCNNDGNEEFKDSYDIWQADEPAGKHDGGYENVDLRQTEDTSRMHFEKCASECYDDGEETSNKCNDTEKNCEQDNSEPRGYRIMNEKDDASSREDVMACDHQNCSNSSNVLDDNERLRGGCGGVCGPCAPRPKVACGVVKVVESPCVHCMKREPEPCRVIPSCSTCSSPCSDRRACCSLANERPICKKTIIRCRPSCTKEPQTCAGSGCCGSGCRGGCGKPGQTCMPSRPCAVPPCRPCSPCSPPRPCPPQPSCCCSRKCGTCCPSGGSVCYCRSKSPVCRVNRVRRCSADRAETIDEGCCRPKVGCECLGGGLDCQRCGRKVYQAEMQIVSGIPFHNICFSCYCCRKPLEPLTYQENCGEIYCKQCYVRNFGPQGYGYGVGPGALQTPM